MGYYEVRYNCESQKDNMEELAYLRLRKKYFTNPEQRPLIFEELWNLFDMENNHYVTKFIRKLSLLELKADFCMAIDDLFIRTKPKTSLEDCMEAFKQFFWIKVRQDLEMKQGIRTPLMRGLKWCRKSKDGKHIPKKGLKFMRIMFELEALGRFKQVKDNPRPTNEIHAQLKEQELEYTKGELENFVLDRFEPQDWEDFVYHNVYGESLRDVAHYRKCDYSSIKRRTDKVKKAIGEYYDSNGNKKRFR